MSLELKVHTSFFREFATKTWTSPYEILRELIENAFDEDATTVIVSILSNGNVVIEDNAGMNLESIKKFLILGSPHKANETISPKLKRIRTGRYGTGRLSFLTSFDNMKIKTKLDEFNKAFIIDSETVDGLANGNAKLKELSEYPLNRNGTEIFLNNSKIYIDPIKLLKELKKLSILKYPLFEVYLKNSKDFKEWDLNDTQIIKCPDVQGYKISVNMFNPDISGEIIIAKRPLNQDEKGIAIMVGNHMVHRSNFGFDNKLNRVTGFVKCDQLTSRFADKSALIENDLYFKFNRSMKDFIVDKVFPSLTEYEDVLITREESKIYKEIDKVMGQAVMEMLQIDEEVQGFESVEITGIEEDKVNLSKDDQKRQLQQTKDKQQEIIEVDNIENIASSLKEQKLISNSQNFGKSDTVNDNHYHQTSKYNTEQSFIKSDIDARNEPSTNNDYKHTMTRFNWNNQTANNNNNNNDENIDTDTNNNKNYNSNRDSNFIKPTNEIKKEDNTSILDTEKYDYFIKNGNDSQIDHRDYDNTSSIVSSSIDTDDINKKVPSQNNIESSDNYHNPHNHEYPSTTFLQNTPTHESERFFAENVHDIDKSNNQSATTATINTTVSNNTTNGAINTTITMTTTTNINSSYSDKFPNQVDFIKKTIRKPVLKKTFALKKIGYKVIPYEDETDSRYSFTNDNIVFVNKAHSTYKVESERGDEFLFRHITNIVAEVVVGSKYPEARDILEIQNKLISEAIKIHDYSLLKK